MKNQVCSQHIFEPNNECAKEAIHGDDGSESSPTVFVSLKITDEEGITNNEPPSVDRGDPGVNKIYETNEEVIHSEFVSASAVDAAVTKNIENHDVRADTGVNETAEMTKEDKNSTENSVSSSSPPAILDSSEGLKINENTEKLVTNNWTILKDFKFSPLDSTLADIRKKLMELEFFNLDASVGFNKISKIDQLVGFPPNNRGVDENFNHTDGYSYSMAQKTTTKIGIIWITVEGTKNESVIVEWMSKEEYFTFLESSQMYVWVKGNKFPVNIKVEPTPVVKVTNEMSSSYLSSSLWLPVASSVQTSTISDVIPMNDADANVDSRINDLLPIAIEEPDNVVSPSTITNPHTFVAGTCSTVGNDPLLFLSEKIPECNELDFVKSYVTIDGGNLPYHHTLQMIELDYSTHDGYLAESGLIKDLELSGKSDSKCGKEKVNIIVGGMDSELQPFYYCDPKNCLGDNNKTRFPCPTEFIDFKYQAQRCEYFYYEQYDAIILKRKYNDKSSFVKRLYLSRCKVHLFIRFEELKP